MLPKGVVNTSVEGTPTTPAFVKTGRTSNLALNISLYTANEPLVNVPITEYSNGQKTVWQADYKGDIFNFTSADGKLFTFLERRRKQQPTLPAPK